MSRPIVIAHLIATNFFGGPEKQIVNHALRLDRERYRFVLLTFLEPGLPNQLAEVARSRGVEVVEVPVGSSFDPRAIWRIARELRRLGVRLLLAHGYKSNVIGRISSWLARVPQVSVSRGWTAENRKIRLFERLDKLFLGLADHVVAVSHGQRAKVLALGVAPGRVSVIHNAISLDDLPGGGGELRRELGLPGHAVLVASAGRLSPEKNYAGMIRAAQQAAGDPSLYFVVFGEGFLRPELEEQIRAAGLTGRFLLPGFRSDLQAVLNEIDIFMLPSFTEGLPNVILEAFAARKPVIATRVGGTPEVVQDGVSGFLTQPEEADEMARHLRTLGGDPALRLRMGEAGYRFVASEFGFERQTELYQAFYPGQLR